MTKSTITREQLHERARENVKALKMASRQTAFESAREEILADLQLAELALAAMDGKPVLEIESEPVFTLEVARADYKGQKLGNHFGFITLDAARELKEGNYQLYTAQPAPVVPDDVLDALQKVARIRLDLNDFDGDRRGIADCLCDAEEALIEVVNRRAAMLAAAPQPQNAPQNITEIIPNELIAAVNRLLDSNGSRGCYSAIQCGDAHDEIERFLAAAPAGIPMIPDGYVMVPKEMTDEIGEAIAMQANCCGGIALDIYAAMLAAAQQEVPDGK